MLWIEISLPFLFFYSILILFFYKGWLKLPEFNRSNDEIFVDTTIIVPFRNEESNFENLIYDLNLQTYPKEHFNIIAINDHSEDNSHLIAKSLKNSILNLIVIDLPDETIGKKNAIKVGVIESQAELIITVDADCRVKEKWLETIVAFYSTYKPSMIICPLFSQNESNIFEYMQSLELLSLIASGAGSAAINRPILCNGANLAFNRKIFLQLIDKLNNPSPSGDDIFLLLAIKKMKGLILFLKSPFALAHTNVEKSFKQFRKQRKRWASKTRYYSDPDIILTAILIAIINLIQIVYFAAGFYNKMFWILFIIFFITKSLFDFLLLSSFAKFFQKQYLLKYFLITQLAYPFYVVFTAIFSMFGKVQWKQRTYQ
jgi:cellulose synthase/poly-beta-1,6-N-acetylglucosamine synthase-like glycosyltransferase